MSELLNNFWNWYHSLNIGEILNWIITIGVPAFIAILHKKATKAEMSVIKSGLQEKAISQAFTQATNQIFDKVESMTKQIETLTNNNAVLGSMINTLMISANVDVEVKKQIVKEFKDMQTTAIKEIEKGEDLAVQTIEVLEKQIEKEEQIEKQPTELDRLVNAFKN